MDLVTQTPRTSAYVPSTRDGQHVEFDEHVAHRHRGFEDSGCCIELGGRSPHVPTGLTERLGSRYLIGMDATRSAAVRLTGHETDCMQR